MALQCSNLFSLGNHKDYFLRLPNENRLNVEQNVACAMGHQGLYNGIECDSTNHDQEPELSALEEFMKLKYQR